MALRWSLLRYGASNGSLNRNAESKNADGVGSPAIAPPGWVWSAAPTCGTR